MRIVIFLFIISLIALITFVTLFYPTKARQKTITVYYNGSSDTYKEAEVIFRSKEQTHINIDGVTVQIICDSNAVKINN